MAPLDRIGKRFRALVELNDGIIALVDSTGKSLFRSSSAARITGWTPEELATIPVLDHLHPDDRGAVRELIDIQLSRPGMPIPVSARFRHRNGHYIWLEGVVTNLLFDPEIGGIIINLRDITRAKVAEEKITKISRLYLFLSQINQMIVRTTDEETLFKEACHIAIDPGLFRMAWIGILNGATGILEPVMHDGIDRNYLAAITVKADKTVPEGRGPSGTALVDGASDFCNDVATDPRMEPWRALALERGYHSMIAIPLRKFGQVIGAFSLYADVINFFDTEEIVLLEKAASDISFALEIVENERQRKRAETALLESRNKYQTLTEISPVGIFHTNQSGLTTYVNPRWCEISGVKSEDALGNGWLAAVHPADRDQIIQGWKQATEALQPSWSQYRFVQPDGRVSWVIGQAAPEKNAQNQVSGYVGTITDISPQKMAEEKLINEKNKAQQYLNVAAIMLLSLDISGTVRLINPKGCEILGYEAADILGANWIDTVIPEDIRKEVKVTFDMILSGDFESVRYYENAVVTRQGDVRLMGWYNEVLRDVEGQIIGVLSSGEDITVRKKSEQENRLLNEQLEQRVQERTAELRLANRDLEEMNDLFIGREARIIELKEELQTLKKELRLSL